MHFLEIFGHKKCLFESKTVFLGQEVHYYMVYIAYFTELNLQICDYAQQRRICCKNCKYALDEHFHGHFCPRRKAAKFCHPGLKWWRRRKRKTTSAWGNQAFIILAGCNQALIVSEVLGRESDAIVLNNTLIEGIV